MISVVVKINDKEIAYAHAVRIKGKGKGERCTYKTHHGDVIQHDYDEGALALVKRLLDMKGVWE